MGLVKITVLVDYHNKYRNKKGYISASVLGACDINFKFLYALPRRLKRNYWIANSKTKKSIFKIKSNRFIIVLFNSFKRKGDDLIIYLLGFDRFYFYLS